MKRILVLLAMLGVLAFVGVGNASAATTCPSSFGVKSMFPIPPSSFITTVTGATSCTGNIIVMVQPTIQVLNTTCAASTPPVPMRNTAFAVNCILARGIYTLAYTVILTAPPGSFWILIPPGCSVLPFQLWVLTCSYTKPFSAPLA